MDRINVSRPAVTPAIRSPNRLPGWADRSATWRLASSSGLTAGQTRFWPVASFRDATRNRLRARSNRFWAARVSPGPVASPTATVAASSPEPPELSPRQGSRRRPEVGRPAAGCRPPASASCSRQSGGRRARQCQFSNVFMSILEVAHLHPMPISRSRIRTTGNLRRRVTCWREQHRAVARKAWHTEPKKVPIECQLPGAGRYMAVFMNVRVMG